MSWIKTQDDNKAIVKFDGALLIADVAAARDDILAGTAARDSIEMDVTNLTDIDTAGVQLLLASARSAKASNKAFTLSGDSTLVAAAAAKLGLQPGELGDHGGSA